MIYLAIHFGFEGWQLTEFSTPEAAIEAVKSGMTYGQKWKILKELSIEVKETE